MKTLNIIAFIFFLLVFSAVQGYSQAKINLNRTSFDMGTIYEGEIKTIRLVVSNRGSDPLKVYRIETSCGCTSAKSSVPTIDPGMADTVMISFNSMGFGGKVTKSVAVQSNDPASPYIEATFTGIVVREIQIVPASSVINFGSAPVGAAGKKSFLFTNLTSERLELLRMTSADSALKAHIPTKIMNPSDTVAISFEFTPRSATYVDNIFYLETSSPRQPRVPFRFMYVGK